MPRPLTPANRESRPPRRAPGRPKADSEAPTAIISRRAAERLRAGHVWVYRSDIQSEPPEGSDLVSVTDERGMLLGTGLYSPASQIALRVISTGLIDGREAWLDLIEERLHQAIALREGMLDETSDACRLVFSEADELPGLIIDRYGDLLLVEILSKALDADDIRARIVNVLKDKLHPSTIVEGDDARIRALEQMSPPKEAALYSEGPLAQLATIFHLNGLAFHYDARSGQKTGAFLDQRLNYAAAAHHAHGEALDVCTYQGGFALHLAQTCSQVTGIDASHAALEVAEENLAVNQHRIQAPVEWVEGNAFDVLRDWSTTGREFDTIVLDPPAFAKSKRAAAGALRGYKELNLRAMKMLRPGGTLVTCSCSHHISSDEFQAIVSAAGADAHRRLRLLERRGAAPDHPVVLNIPETEYLKCLILSVD